MLARLNTTFGIIGSCVTGVLLVAGATGCSSDTPAASPVDSGTPPADTGTQDTGTTSDGSSDAPSEAEVGPVAAVTDPDCSDRPKSCCFASDKYGGVAGADKSCGPNGDQDCCAYDDIPGGTFNRLNDSNFAATMPSFKLGRFLITTARFKVWMEEGGGLRANAPAEGAGAHPTLGTSVTGWKSDWNAKLADTPEALDLKVKLDPNTVGWGCTLDWYPQYPNLPMDCIDYYLIQAFCAWDGGYAITEAMWEYAARGGSEQRQYAWGSHAPDSFDYSVHCLQGGGTWNVDLWCDNPQSPWPKNVGSSKDGAGKWGTHDLMGNLLNMTIDDNGPMPSTCTNDCVSRITPDPNRVIGRGISFLYPNSLGPSQYNSMINSRPPVTSRKDFNGANWGFRCAYPNSWPAQQ